MQPLASEGDHAICAMPCGHVIGKSCGLQLLARAKKCPYCNHAASARTLRRLFLPGSLLVSQPSQELQAENESLKKRLRELEDRVAGTIEPRDGKRKSENELIDVSHDVQVVEAKMIATKQGSFAKCGVFDDAGNFYFCSKQEPCSVQIYDSDFRVLAWVPQISGCKNLEISKYKRKSKSYVLGWGSTGAVSISPDMEISNFPGNFQAASIIGHFQLTCDNLGRLVAGNREMKMLQFPDIPHSILAFSDYFLSISRKSVMKIHPEGAIEEFAANEIPGNSVSAARVRGPGNFFILSYRDPEPHLLLFEAFGKSAKLISKITGYRNPFVLSRPAACVISEIPTWKFAVAMIDEGAGFIVWRTTVESVGTPQKFPAENPAHFDFFLGGDGLKLAAVGPGSVSIFQLPLE